MFIRLFIAHQLTLNASITLSPPQWTLPHRSGRPLARLRREEVDSIEGERRRLFLRRCFQLHGNRSKCSEEPGERFA